VTDVLIELRIDPLVSTSDLNLTHGNFEPSRYPSGGFTNSERLSLAQGGAVVRATSLGNGLFRVGIAPIGGFGTGHTYEFALLVETRTPSGDVHPASPPH
jgi:hypothetical protein